MPKYLLVARDSGTWESAAGTMSPSEMQAILAQYSAWGARVAGQGKLKEGHKLRDGEGKVIRSQKERLRVTDGPHSESKEVIGGIWVLEADSYDEVVKLASDSPHLQFGSLEVRQIEDME
jgi:hypothetical protein